MGTQFLVLTLLGEDRPGLVESLSQIIAAHEGNWQESRMSHLAGKFAGILRASVPAMQAEALTRALHGLEAQGLRLMLEWSAVDTPPSQYQRLKLDLLGNDRPGIIRDISHALVWRGINIDELQTEYISAPMSGEMLFKATAYLRIPPDVVIDEFQDNLEQIAHDLMVDVTLQAVSDMVLG
jgi:glycine cleavage system regulatory protein